MNAKLIIITLFQVDSYLLIIGITKHPESNNFMMIFNMKLSDDVIEQIKDFSHYDLTEEQKLLIDKLILNEELKNNYKKYGLCKRCNQPNTGGNYIIECQCQ